MRAGARGRVGSRTVREIRERCLPREELERCVSLSLALLLPVVSPVSPARTLARRRSLSALLTRPPPARSPARSVNAIERIDEVEELNLVLEHYAVSWANLLPSEGEGAAGRGGEGAGGGGGGIGLRDAVEEEGS